MTWSHTIVSTALLKSGAPTRNRKLDVQQLVTEALSRPLASLTVL